MKQQVTIKTDKPFTVFSLEADRDYIIARMINFTGRAFSSRAGYYSQQCLEKYLKALLVQELGEYIKTHNLIDLVNYCNKFDSSFNEANIIEKFNIFNEFIDLGRYGAEASFDPHAVKTEKFTTAGVTIWEDKNIFILDELVYLIRCKLNYAKVGFSDSLKAIIENNQSDYFVGTWKFPIPLKDILVTQNEYFK